jgi:hypothetical protein
MIQRTPVPAEPAHQLCRWESSARSSTTLEEMQLAIGEAIAAGVPNDAPGYFVGHRLYFHWAEPA